MYDKRIKMSEQLNQKVKIMCYIPILKLRHCKYYIKRESIDVG